MFQSCMYERTVEETSRVLISQISDLENFLMYGLYLISACLLVFTTFQAEKCRHGNIIGSLGLV